MFGMLGMFGMFGMFGMLGCIPPLVGSHTPLHKHLNLFRNVGVHTSPPPFANT